MSDAAIKDQPEVAVAAAEAQTTQETAPAVATTEQSDAKVTEAAPPAENGADKTTETTAEQKAQVDRKDFKKNRKYDPSTQPVTDDPVKIRNQVILPPNDTPASGLATQPRLTRVAGRVLL